MKQELTASERLQAKTTALHTAHRLHPDKKQKVGGNQPGWQGLELATYQDVAASPEDVLKTADTIFEWLVK